jgi:hypothetical protein
VAGTPGAPPTSICSFADFLKMADGPKPPVESDLRRCIIR